MSSDGTRDAYLFRHMEAVDTILQVLRETTGLRVVVVARVEPDCWTACAVLDEAGFGLKRGDRLDPGNTY